MLRRKTPLIAICCFLGASMAGAQGEKAALDTQAESVEVAVEAADEDDYQRAELTLFLGWLLSDSLDSIGPGAKLDFDDDLDLGFVFSVPTPFEGFRVELIYSRNEMRLTADRPGQPQLAEVDQQYVHVGGLWELGDGPNRGFATASVGVVELEPEGRLRSSESMPSFGLGGGGKFHVSDRIGLRVEGRLLGHVGDSSMFCDRTTGCLGQVSSSLLVQFQAAVGLTLRF